MKKRQSSPIDFFMQRFIPAVCFVMKYISALKPQSRTHKLLNSILTAMLCAHRAPKFLIIEFSQLLFIASPTRHSPVCAYRFQSYRRPKGSKMFRWNARTERRAEEDLPSMLHIDSFINKVCNLNWNIMYTDAFQSALFSRFTSHSGTL